MLKEKQLEIIEQVYQKIKNEYPESELGKISFNDNDTWVDVLVPDQLVDNEELDKLIVHQVFSILQNYGYPIQFYAVPKQEARVVA